MAARERVWFAAGLGAAWLFLVYLAHLTPIRLDDWYEIAWNRRHPFTVGNVLEFARYNYFNYNPRPGETFLLLVNGPPIVHLILTPLFELALLLVVYVLAHGHAPRADRRTLAELAVMQALLWLVIPAPGMLYFYRPFTTNYLFASTIQLSVFVPFRLELGRDARGPSRAWLVPVLLVWGAFGGMTNEHTGPTAIVVAWALVYGAARARRLRAWMVAAAAGLVIGYALLYFAPGQTVRYAGLTNDISPLNTLRHRTLGDCLHIITMVLTEAQVGMAVVAGLCLYARRRKVDALDALDLRTLAVISIAMLAALLITATTFASPIVEDRVLLAPCLLITVALGAATPVVWRDGRARALLVAAAVVVLLYEGIVFVHIYRDLADESDARVAALSAARPGEVVKVAPSAWPVHDQWSYGEDLMNTYMREFVAHRVFDIGGLELDPLPAGAQPTPPEHMHVAVTYDPPIDARAARPEWPLWRFVPSQWAWIVREINESLVDLRDVPGHTLRAIDVTVETPIAGLPGRPIYIVRWQPGAYRHVDLKYRANDLGLPYEEIDLAGLAMHPTEAWLQACGRTRPLVLTRAGGELQVPVDYDCSGNHTVFVCDASECWLAGRYW
jgi:hypothetical protein